VPKRKFVKNLYKSYFEDVLESNKKLNPSFTDLDLVLLKVERVRQDEGFPIFSMGTKNILISFLKKDY